MTTGLFLSGPETLDRTFDDKGRVYQTISPDTGTTTYQYDPAGNMISKTDAKGVTISYVYDALNRLTKIDFPTDTDIIYSYNNCPNGKGRLCSMTDASGTTAYEYTPKGQVKKETKVIDSTQYVTQYAYDQNGNLKTMTYPSGRVLTYNYTSDRAASVLNNAANLAASISYKPFGGISSITYGNGLTQSIGYDNQYHLASMATGTFQNLTYGYDNNGNITSIAPGKTYTYDVLDRLGTATGPWGSLGWTYDGVGNRQTENTSSYIYAPNTNKLTSANGINFGYDNNGNTSTEGSRIYTYSQNQRMIQAVNGSTTTNYTYNGNGQRVKKVVNGITTIFHYSLNGQLIAESNNAGTINAEYVYLNGQPLAKIEGVNTYYYHNDHLATPQKMTDSSGVVRWSADYKPFGEVTIDQTVTTITNNLRFPGQYFDAETGLHYNRYRDYNPALDRYIEWDPIGLKGNDLNLYAYVRNPLRFIDPWGLELQVTVQEGTGTGTYGGTVTVVNTDTNTTVFTGQGSSLPNNSTTQNTVATGTYSGTNTTRASGGPGIYVGETPTAPGSPRNTAYDIFVHCGSTQTNRGSAGCLTVRPDQCQEFFRNFTPEQPVTVNVRR